MWRPAAEQSAAESAAAESMERRAGTKGNASQQSTCRAQSRISVSQAPDRMRQLLAVWTRGGSRMRESRTYGSVRGACDETHVPTATWLFAAVRESASGTNAKCFHVRFVAA